MTGYSRSDLETGELTWRKMTPPEWMEVSEGQMMGLEQTGRIGPYEQEYVHKDGSRSWMLLAGTELEDGTIVKYCMDISDRIRAEEQVVAGLDQISDILESIADGFYAVDKDWRLTFVNRRSEELWGRPREEMLGKLLWDLFPGIDVQATRGYQLHVTAAAERRPIREEFESVLLGCWVSLSIWPQRDGGLSVYFRDISDRKRVEEERELLARELSHRVKNTLAVVQALAMQTRVREGSIDAYREAFVGRLQAMARAHNLLLEAQWRGTDLQNLVAQALEAYRVDHPEVVEADGPSLSVTAKQALGLNLVLHELGTNAAKYGALSHHGGRLRVSWQIEQKPERRVSLLWQERDGPPVVPPQEQGFGTRLIEQACSHELGGTAELNYAPDGLVCKLVFPLSL
jgi:PAS domain S-box-containing protein